jgi:hypothetical protein
MIGERHNSNNEYPAIYYNSKLNKRESVLRLSLPALIGDWVGLIEMRHKSRVNNAPVLTILVDWKKKNHEFFVTSKHTASLITHLEQF